MTAAAPSVGIGEEDALRADLYDFLGALLARPPSKALLKKAACLSGDETPIGEAAGALARVAAVTGERAAKAEFDALFIGLGRGELLPYASYYMTGFLNEKPLASLRGEMAGLGVRRADNVFEPEDNIASICEIMAGLIRGRFGGACRSSPATGVFNRFAAPWAGHFFSDLAAAKSSVLYAPVGALGAAFMEVERVAFRLAGQFEDQAPRRAEEGENA